VCRRGNGSTWHRQDIAREVALAVPDSWAAGEGDVRAFIAQATELAMGQCLVLEPGSLGVLGRAPRRYKAG
jgi:hypothetical protein